MSDDWKKPAQPPPPMFFGEKERDLVKQVNDEIIERVVGQQVLYFAISREHTNYHSLYGEAIEKVLYFPIDIEHTEFHPLYGEAIEKTFLPPVRVYALVEYQGVETEYLENISLDKITNINVKFHKRRLTEDQDLFVREGDFVRYGSIYYEIVKLTEPKLLFGQAEFRFEIQATCVRARDGLFNAT